MLCKQSSHRAAHKLLQQGLRSCIHALQCVHICVCLQASATWCSSLRRRRLPRCLPCTKLLPGESPAS